MIYNQNYHKSPVLTDAFSGIRYRIRDYSNVVAVPLVLEYSIGRKVKFLTSLGPCIGYQFKVEQGFYYPDTGEEQKRELKPENPVFLSIMGGLGAGTQLNRNLGIMLNARYIYKWQGLDDWDQMPVSFLLGLPYSLAP
ncbi:MAG: hypothetical protein ACPF9D_10365 [Owenweeksia sp.]